MLELEQPISALDFLDLQFELHYLKATKKDLDKKKYELPELSEYIHGQDFCKVFAAWSHGALHFQFVTVQELSPGDKIHLGIDTRNLKNALLIHRFCHLFELNLQEKRLAFFEKTSFRRLDDAHELCATHLLKAQKEKSGKRHSVYIEIEKNCLTGFDPTRFDRLSFFYMIEKKMGTRQDFCMSNQIWNIFDAPNLWQTFQLKK